MLTYTMDVEERSRWIVSTPSASEVAQPYFCSEVGDFYAREHFSTARSDKNSYLLFYTLGGEGTICQGGQTVKLGKGQALLMNCRTPQSYGTSAGHGHWYHLWTHIDGMGVALAGTDLGLPRLVPLTLALSRVQPHFDVLFERLNTESVENTMRVGLAVHALVTELVVAAREVVQASEDDPVRVACAYVEKHYADEVSVNDLAVAAMVSPSYLIRLFKRQMGTTPHDYLLRYRISRAKELLAETTLTSAAIARRVGFNSESNFSYRFSKMVGQSPRAYRQGAPGLAFEQRVAV
jgi:AraC-like DNA-binding protein